MEYIIETENLVKQYGPKRALDGVSIHVNRGDIYGLIGKNGAGKTTLMKIILGIAQKNSGEVKLFGSDKLYEERKRIGSLIESPAIYKKCTAYENMLRFSMLYGADKSEINGILNKVGLGDTGKKLAGAFSLGMKQRLGIAIALLNKPEILILDEPINGLDPQGIKEIRDTILALNAEGVTFMISSHLLDELQKIVTTYGIISEGRLIEETSAENLMDKCKKCVEISVANADINDINALLHAQYSDIKTEIKDEKLRLLNHFDDRANINTLLVSSGVLVNELNVIDSGFEDYFIERLGK